MREKLEALWQAVYPSAKFFDQWQRFDELLDAEAWLDAAMMLVPEGWDWARWSKGSMVLTKPHEDEKLFAYTIEADGDTPAEALLAAIEKARTDHG